MQSETQNVYNEDDYLHVGALILSYLRFLMRRWYLFLGLMIVPMIVVFMLGRSNTVSWYTDTVYYSLERTGDVYTDAAITARVSASISMLTSTADFRAQLQEQTTDNVNAAGWYFSSASEESANLFHVTVQCRDQKLAGELLTAFENVFPALVNKTTGNTTLTIMDEARDGVITIMGDSSIKKMAYAGIISFAVWFIIATIVIISVRKIYSEDDMDQVVNAQCLGIMPFVPKKKRENSTRETLLLTNDHLDTNYQQAFRSFASRIERSLVDKPKQVIMVTSTLRQEGKSLLVMNLALSLHRHGKKVAIIDGDLYQAGVCKAAQIDPDHAGLSDFMMGNKKNGIFQLYNNMIIVPPGTKRSVGMGIMNVERFSDLLKVLKKYADVILIDTPPAGELGDSVIFSGMADQVIYVVRGNYAEVRDIRKGIEPFVQNRKLVGYVLNCVNNDAVSAGYRYGYGYGSYYSRYHNYGSYGNGYGSNRYGYGSYASYGNYDESSDQEQDW